MSSPRSPPGTPQREADSPLSTSRMAVGNRNSWIYMPTDATSLAQGSNTPGSHTHTMSRHHTPDERVRQINVAVDTLSKMDFTDAVTLICEKNKITPEEAMRQLYNCFYGDKRDPNEPQTWSSHRQQRPAPPKSPQQTHPDLPTPVTHGKSTENVWNIPDAALEKALVNAAHAGLQDQDRFLPSSPSMPTFPSQSMVSIPRHTRGATISNAYKMDGTSVDQRSHCVPHLGGLTSVNDPQYFDDRAPYNPTASTFTPSGPQHSMSKSLNISALMYGLNRVPAENQAFRRSMNTPLVGDGSKWHEKSTRYQTKSPPSSEVAGYDKISLDSLTLNGDLSPPSMPLPPKLNQGGTDQKRFIPMNAALKSGLYHNPTLAPTSTPTFFYKAPVSPPTTKFSERYLGQHTDANASANIPEDYNCAIWIRNLPPDVTYTELLGSIKKIGRIWCSYINVPDYEKHHTAAAKVVFYRPESARTFLHYVWSQNPDIRGYAVKADLNRIKSAPHPISEGTSRILIVTGEDWFANEEYLVEWFGQQCQFQLDQAVTHVKMHGRAVVEFRFGSYRSQAEAGFKALTINRPKGFEKVEFGDDPCEHGEVVHFTARQVALQRIQGSGL